MSHKEIRDVQDMIGRINTKIVNVLSKKKDKEVESSGTLRSIPEQE